MDPNVKLTLRLVKELTRFKNELISLVMSIKFRKLRNHFQDRLQQDFKKNESIK